MIDLLCNQQLAGNYGRLILEQFEIGTDPSIYGVTDRFLDIAIFNRLETIEDIKKYTVSVDQYLTEDGILLISSVKQLNRINLSFIKILEERK